MKDVATSNDPKAAIQHLSSNSVLYAATLKMLTLHPEACSVKSFENANGWAILTEMQTVASRWDREAYPNTSLVIALDGNDEALLKVGFNYSPKQDCIFKVTNHFVQSLARSIRGVRLAQTFVCYSSGERGFEEPTKVSGVEEYRIVSQEAVGLLNHMGYTQGELEGYFARGASWFGFFLNGTCVSICLVYPNGANVWEIGGVYTQADKRGNGYAKQVVQHAVQTLLRRKLKPRYVFRSDNKASQVVAEAAGLHYFTSIEHYLVG